MNSSLPLHRPALYNPALWSREEVKSYFVARTALLNRIVDDLRREKPGTRPQHRLILGLRGMGKSTLLCRIAVAVEDDAALNDSWLPLTFPEEQYNVASLADFWLNCLDALGDLMERRGDRKAVAAFDAEVAALDRKNPDGALKALVQATKRLKRRLLLLVDNIDLILDRLKKEDWALRESLQAHPEIMLIGASARAMEATYDYGAAFYDFFKVDELRGLTEAEMRETILNLARLRGVESAIGKALDEPGRLRVLHTLTGGNPRTAVLLYGVLLKGMDGDVRADLEGLLDEVTPLYKARFEELPPLSQQLMDKLALNWDPMTARQLADVLDMEVNLVSAQLSRLIEAGVVEKVKPGQGKRAAFQVGERFFNIWYLMRASRRVRRKLVWFVDFLRVFYSTEELRRAARNRLGADSGDVRDIEYALALSRALGPEPLAKALETHALESLFDGELRAKIEEVLDLSGEDKDLMPKAQRIQLLKQIKTKLPVVLRKAKVRFSIPRFVEAVLGVPWEPRIRQALAGIESASAQELSSFRSKLLKLVEWKKREVGQHIYRCLNQAIACGEMQNEEDREGAAAAAERFSCPMLALLPRLKDAALGLPNLLEAEDVARQAIALEPNGPYYWRILGDVLAKLHGRTADAEAAYRKSLVLDPENAPNWTYLGNLLQEELGRQEEAEQAFRRAVELDPDDYHPLQRLGRFLLRFRVNARDTEKIVVKACELGPDDPDTWVDMATFVVARNHDLAKGYESAKRAVDLAPDRLDGRYIAAATSLALERPEEALGHLRIWFQNTDELDDARIADAAIARIAIDVGFGGELLRLMDESGASDRRRPLREALAAAVANNAALLDGIAPEVRIPALEILAEIAPKLVKTQS